MRKGRGGREETLGGLIEGRERWRQSKGEERWRQSKGGKSELGVREWVEGVLTTFTIVLMRVP